MVVFGLKLEKNLLPELFKKFPTSFKFKKIKDSNVHAIHG